MNDAAPGRILRAALLAAVATQIPPFVVFMAAVTAEAGTTRAAWELIGKLDLSSAFFVASFITFLVVLATAYFLGVTAWLRLLDRLSLTGLLVAAIVGATVVEAIQLAVSARAYGLEHTLRGVGTMFGLALASLSAGSFVWWRFRPRA